MRRKRPLDEWVERSRCQITDNSGSAVACAFDMIARVACLVVLGCSNPTASSSISRPAVSIDDIWSTAELAKLEGGHPAVIRTVVSGSVSEDLPVRFVGLYPQASNGALLWLETDPAEPRWSEWLGVVAGMSGSPVLIDGRLAGAVSYRFASSGRSAFPFGATPIDAMLADKSRTAPMESPSDVLPIPLLLSAGGNPSSVAEVIPLPSTVLPVATSSGAQSEPCQGDDGGCDAKRLAAGDPVAVILLTGTQFTYAGMGTVTAVDGDRIWAFGHPFLGNGDTGLPFSAAHVFGFFPDPLAGSHKVMEPTGSILGTIQRDSNSGIQGTFDSGAVPSMTITTLWTNSDVKDASVAKATHFMPLVMFDLQMQSLAQNAIIDSLGFALDHTLGDGTVAVDVNVSFSESDLHLEQTYARISAVDIDVANAGWTTSLVSQLSELIKRFPDHPVDHVKVSGHYSDAAAQLVLVSCEVHGPTSDTPVPADQTIAIQPSEALQVTVHALNTSSQMINDFNVTLRVPQDTAPGQLALIVSPTRPVSSMELSVVDEYARSFEEEIQARNELANADTEDDFFVGLYVTNEANEPTQAIDEIRVTPWSKPAAGSIALPVITDDSSTLDEVPAVSVQIPSGY